MPNFHKWYLLTILSCWWKQAVHIQSPYYESTGHSPVHCPARARWDQLTRGRGLCGIQRGTQCCQHALPQRQNPKSRQKGKRQWGANIHWYVAKRLQLCHEVTMAIKFCENTKFFFGTFMKIKSLIFSPVLDFLFLTRIKHLKKVITIF